MSSHPAHHSGTPDRTPRSALPWAGAFARRVAAKQIASIVIVATLAAAIAGCSGDDPDDPTEHQVITDSTGLYLKAMERVGNGVSPTTIISIDTTAAGNAITVRTVINNPTSATGYVDCSLTADPSLQATPVGAVTGVPVSAHGGTATCQFSLITAGIGAFPLQITVAPTPGTSTSTSSKTTTATLRVLSGGKFSFYDVSAIDFQQRWFNLLASSAFPAESLSLQQVRMSELSLVVLPTQDIIGSFTLKGTVSSGTMTYPAGVVSGTLHRSLGGRTCELTVGPNAQFTGAPSGFPNGIGYFADICAEPATVGGSASYQRITVDYTQSLANSLMNPGPYLMTGTATLKIELSFTLQGTTTADKATATITIPVPSPIQRSLTNFDGSRILWTEQNTSPPTVATP